ncbi:MAG: hemagglutinin protein [Myxococcales bacterium]|nr:hemagglutinin protein [Myxococcales bacterium]
MRNVAALSLVAALSISPAAHAQMAQAMMSVQPDAVPQATGCKLAYGGGPLMQKVKVFDIFYSPGNTYKDQLAGYFGAITQSAHFDWLSEYNVTNYKIGRGSYLGMYEDTNSATAKKTIDDSAIGKYIDTLIAAGKVPAPDDDTIYFIFFPASVTITLQGSSSCSVFCAYHNSYNHGSQIARFAVMPDVTQAPCAGGCGSSPTAFNNLTSVASHELIEAVTDPDGNSAWVDSKSGCGEIGDICNGQEGTVGNYTVQKEWSNKLNSCIATNPNVSVNDFSVAAAPAMVNVPVGGSATTTITLTKVSGMAENATLTATAPTGLTTAFAPASVTSAGGTSMLTIGAAPTAMIGSSQKITVKATGTSVAPTVDITVMVVAPPDMAMQPDMAQPPTGGSGGNGGGGSGGTGGGGSGGGGGTGGTGGNGANGTTHGSTGCSIGGGEIGASWAAAALLLLGLAFRRRRA